MLELCTNKSSRRGSTVFSGIVWSLQCLKMFSDLPRYQSLQRKVI